MRRGSANCIYNWDYADIKWKSRSPMHIQQSMINDLS